jgi:hypothetical protein
MGALDEEGDEFRSNRLRLADADGRSAQRLPARHERGMRHAGTSSNEPDQSAIGENAAFHSATMNAPNDPGAGPLTLGVNAQPSDHPALADERNARVLPVWPRLPAGRGKEMQTGREPNLTFEPAPVQAAEPRAGDQLSPVAEPPRLKVPGSR